MLFILHVLAIQNLYLLLISLHHALDLLTPLPQLLDAFLPLLEYFMQFLDFLNRMLPLPLRLLDLVIETQLLLLQEVQL